MDAKRFITIFSILFSFLSVAVSQTLIRLKSENPFSGDRKILRDDGLYCESWRFTVETNDAGDWKTIPDKCLKFVEDYMTGPRYKSDLEVVSDDAISFASTVNVANDGLDAWIFDIDETLLSNIPYYTLHGYGSKAFDENSFDEWVDLAEAPALHASLRLYTQLQQMGFKLILLTGRNEYQKNVTEKNLKSSGYSNWERLILRGSSDMGTLAVSYKSGKRKELEDEGYRVHGSSGDQWSDLMGFATAKRSFKLPNIMYYIP
ncbi:Acid phosphatase, class B-like [Dillenia turbinata]|uniref:Acid phosphatase, class B-like n=1 Tax=Dillenia turbinata TaxID=194707 RepID=A0AAN8W3Y9_9MAGN